MFTSTPVNQRVKTACLADKASDTVLQKAKSYLAFHG